MVGALFCRGRLFEPVRGYCVFALIYGNRGLGRIGESARELDVFVDKVLAYTNAEKAQLVGHSQGGMMPRYLDPVPRRQVEGRPPRTTARG